MFQAHADDVSPTYVFGIRDEAEADQVVKYIESATESHFWMMGKPLFQYDHRGNETIDTIDRGSSYVDPSGIQKLNCLTISNWFGVLSAADEILFEWTLLNASKKFKDLFFTTHATGSTIEEYVDSFDQDCAYTCFHRGRSHMIPVCKIPVFTIVRAMRAIRDDPFEWTLDEDKHLILEDMKRHFDGTKENFHQKLHRFTCNLPISYAKHIKENPAVAVIAMLTGLSFRADSQIEAGSSLISPDEPKICTQIALPRNLFAQFHYIVEEDWDLEKYETKQQQNEYLDSKSNVMALGYELAVRNRAITPLTASELGKISITPFTGSDDSIAWIGQDLATVMRMLERAAESWSDSDSDRYDDGELDYDEYCRLTYGSDYEEEGEDDGVCQVEQDNVHDETQMENHETGIEGNSDNEDDDYDEEEDEDEILQVCAHDPDLMMKIVTMMQAQNQLEGRSEYFLSELEFLLEKVRKVSLSDEYSDSANQKGLKDIDPDKIAEARRGSRK